MIISFIRNEISKNMVSNMRVSTVLGPGLQLGCSGWTGFLGSRFSCLLCASFKVNLFYFSDKKNCTADIFVIYLLIIDLRDDKSFFLIKNDCIFLSGATVNGFVNVSISTLEQRFGFDSWMTGLMAVSYDIGFVLVSFYVSFVLVKKKFN